VIVFHVSLHPCELVHVAAHIPHILLKVITDKGLLFGFDWFYHFTVVLVFTNSCVNPFIYAAKYREFQRGVMRLIWKQNQVESQTTN